MDYESALKYLDSFKNEGIKPRLEHTQYILDKVGFMQNFLVIHVAGSKGKGSVCSFANSILHEAGFKVGLYISPPLQDFTERISVNKKFISKKEVAALVAEIKPAVQELSKSALGSPTIFEVITAMAFRYFQLKKLDYVVLEVGMGGRLDSTNVVNSLVSVVTEIELEHTKYLGDTIEKITHEKAGIIKPYTVCITASDDAVVLKILEETCAKRNTRLLKVGSDIKYGIKKSDSQGQEFSVSGLLSCENLKIKLIGAYQVRNAVTAIAAAVKAAAVNEDAVRKGLLNAKWPGRLEVVQQKPPVMLDGSHTLKGIRTLKDNLKLFKYDKMYIVLGISKDKPMIGMTAELAPLAEEVVATKAKIENAGEPQVIFNEAEKHAKSVIICDVRQAVKYALKKAGKKDFVLIAGSLYVVGGARSIWFKKVEL